MEALTGKQITEAGLTDWRKLGQGLHARYRIPDFTTGVRFLTAIAAAADTLGHHPRATLTDGYLDLARRITHIAAEQTIPADPASITAIELALDTAHANAPPRVQVAYDVAEQRIAAAVAAGAVIVDDSRAPWTTVLADQDGNKACVDTMQPPPPAR